MDIIDEQEAYMSALECCDKHELRGVDRDKVVDWVQDFLVRQGLMLAVIEGKIDIVGVNEDGSDLLFQVTEDGKKYIEEEILSNKKKKKGKQ